MNRRTRWRLTRNFPPTAAILIVVSLLAVFLLPRCGGDKPTERTTASFVVLYEDTAFARTRGLDQRIVSAVEKVGNFCKAHLDLDCVVSVYRTTGQGTGAENALGLEVSKSHIVGVRASSDRVHTSKIAQGVKALTAKTTEVLAERNVAPLPGCSDVVGGVKSSIDRLRLSGGEMHLIVVGSGNSNCSDNPFITEANFEDPGPVEPLVKRSMTVLSPDEAAGVKFYFSGVGEGLVRAGLGLGRPHKLFLIELWTSLVSAAGGSFGSDPAGEIEIARS